MGWGNFFKDLGRGVLKVAAASNPALGMVAPLVDIAEETFGRGTGNQKKEFVVGTVKTLLRGLDNNDDVEFGVKDWAILLECVDDAIELHIKIRKATNWIPE